MNRRIFATTGVVLMLAAAMLSATAAAQTPASGTPTAGTLARIVPHDLLDADGIVWQVQDVSGIKPGSLLAGVASNLAMTTYANNGNQYAIAGAAQPEPRRSRDLAERLTLGAFGQAGGVTMTGLRDEPNVAPLTGCDATRRWIATGTNGVQTVPVGMTVCEAGGLDLFAIAVNVIDGQQGYVASDHVLSLILQRITAATPTAG